MHLELEHSFLYCKQWPQYGMGYWHGEEAIDIWEYISTDYSAQCKYMAKVDDIGHSQHMYSHAINIYRGNVMAWTNLAPQPFRFSCCKHQWCRRLRCPSTWRLSSLQVGRRCSRGEGGGFWVYIRRRTWLLLGACFLCCLLKEAPFGRNPVWWVGVNLILRANSTVRDYIVSRTSLYVYLFMENEI